MTSEPTREELLDWDRRHHWHAFTQMAEYEPLVIARAEGCRLIDIDGREFTETSSDFSARVWQHEFDHLEGVLIIDKMSPLDRLRVRRAVKDLKAAADGDA